ncbi:uncharacterized protein Dvir_GJ26504 [Drosophila virilis]|uniref:Uncharacterized protein n=1 Tax=Drosophila virilis TaxID=7244 RepID=A0A0Q9WVT7_DROVI|nr:uncharacterized protein Dvir_GJ26504 [Drosophila virilis]
MMRMTSLMMRLGMEYHSQLHRSPTTPTITGSSGRCKLKLLHVTGKRLPRGSSSGKWALPSHPIPGSSCSCHVSSLAALEHL